MLFSEIFWNDILECRWLQPYIHYILTNVGHFLSGSCSWILKATYIPILLGAPPLYNCNIFLGFIQKVKITSINFSNSSPTPPT